MNNIVTTITGMLLVYSAHIISGHLHFPPLTSAMLGSWFHSWVVNQIQLGFPIFFEMSVSHWFPKIYREMVDTSPSKKFFWNSLILWKKFRSFLAGNETTQSHFFVFQDKKIQVLQSLEKELILANTVLWKKHLQTTVFSILDLNRSWFSGNVSWLDYKILGNDKSIWHHWSINLL